MIKNEELNKRVEEIKKDNKDIFLKEISKEELKEFHKIIIKCFKELNVIVKGSRALNKYIKFSIYSIEELIHVDYDIYSLNYKKDLEYIVKEFEKSKLEYIKVRVLPFKSDISRLSFYGEPMIDIEEINKSLYKQLKFKKIDGIKYIDPEFYKIDLYSILAQPTRINMNVYEKAYKRLDLIESNYKYKSEFKLKEGGKII